MLKLLNVMLGAWLIFPQLAIGRPALSAGSKRTCESSENRLVGLAPASAPGRNTRRAELAPLFLLFCSHSMICFVSFVKLVATKIKWERSVPFLWKSLIQVLTNILREVAMAM
jgi:hypothetical protein